MTNKEWYKKCCTFIIANLVALTTLALAIVTTFMAIETKRLADISIEQFRIKSYPSFCIVPEDIKFSVDSALSKFQIYNKGEISAFKVTILVLYVFENKSKYYFEIQYQAYYESSERITSLELEHTIYKDSSIILYYNVGLNKNYNYNNLKYAIIFIKFRVPYDQKCQYETFGYILKENFNKNSISPYSWQEITYLDRKNITKRFFIQLNKRNITIKNFFKDYNIKQHS